MKQFLNRLLGRTAKSLPVPVAPATTPPLTDDQRQAQHLLEQGHALEDAGQPAAAETLYLQALTLCPHWSRIALNLGNALTAQGRFEDAAARYEDALRLEPGYGAAHANLGQLHLTLGRYQLAAVHYAAAVQALPQSAEALVGLGSTLEGLQKPTEAERAYRQALILQPGFAGAQLNLAKLLMALGQVELNQQHYPEALERYNKAVQLLPNFADAWSGLGYSFHNLERYAEAKHAYQQALAIEPKNLVVKSNLAQLFIALDQSDQAIPQLQDILASQPDHWPSLVLLGKAMISMNLISKGLTHIYRAAQLQPGNSDIQLTITSHIQYLADHSAQDVFTAHRDYAQQFFSKFYPVEPKFINSTIPGRHLRIGYVSSDLCAKHPISRFIEPVLNYHDAAHFEIHIFDNNPDSDWVTERLKKFTVIWHPIWEMDDDAVTILVCNLGIDILIDLSGYTEGHRLGVFARKPAPIQAAWLGYLNTTGLATMDYRICDIYTDPPGLTEHFHTERLARLPDCQWCHIPFDTLVEVAGLSRDSLSISEIPLLRHGYLTLGSFNNPFKLNDHVLALWASILTTLPNARLHIAGVSSQHSRQHIVSILDQGGVAYDRIEFTPRRSYSEFLISLTEVDLALDPFPYNGGTTSFDILLMGIPLVTLAGDRSIARGGVSLLSNLGLTELIAATPQDYVDIVRQLAHDPARLVALRSSLRDRIQASPLMDGERFTRNLETLYWQMWQSSCAKQHRNLSFQ